jgi:NADH-quinone oxidoreductase subunit C
MLREEYRLHTSYSSARMFLAIPIFVFVIATILSLTLGNIQGTIGLKDMVTGLNAGVFLYGISVGAFGFLGKSYVERRQGKQNFVVAMPEAVPPVIEFLKMEADFDYMVDVTAVDYPKRTPRFDLVYILYSFPRNERIRVKTAVADGARPPSLAGVHLTANWLEREVFDMFGIEFEGHPDMRRILLPDEWQGHPLRKDYPIIKQDESWVRENLGIESGQ